MKDDNQKGPTVLFVEDAKKIFDSLFSRHGFASNEAITKEYSAEIIYRKNNQYIKINANFHPRDYPPYFNVILGEGSTEWPESDWNSAALWRMKERLFPGIKSGEYQLKNLESFLRALLISKSDLEKYAEGFLMGDLTLFKEVRANQNRSREPYKIYTPDSTGKYSEKYDEESKRLKEKYS